MIELAVIADDITGAADTGAQFLTVFSPVHLVDHRTLATAALEPPPQAVCVHTGSRGLPPAEAGRVVFEASRAIRGFAPATVYKKIDSALRGNIGAELEAVMDALAIDLSFIAPAFVEQGRTTGDGIHRLHGVPVAETEMGRDPVAPVRNSSLPGWISGQSRWPVAHIGRDTVERGPEALGRAIHRAAGRGARHLTFDAAQSLHLNRIARVAADQFPQALLCGSAGLARSLADVLSEHPAPVLPPAAAPRLSAGGKYLYVCGSASECLRVQVAELGRRFEIPVEALQAEALLAPDLSDAMAAALDRAAAILARSSLVLQLAPPAGGRLGADSRKLLERFASAALRVIEAGRPVVTKAGAFGTADTLASLNAAVHAGCI